MNNGIRNIHDAIEVKTNRAIYAIGKKRNDHAEAITKQIYDEAGITVALNKLEEVLGNRPHIYSTNGSPLSRALSVAMKELKIYDDLLTKVKEVAENAHIQVVTGDKGEILTELDKLLAKIIK